MTLGPDRGTILRWMAEPLFSPDDDGGGGEKNADKPADDKTGDEKKDGDKPSSGTDSDKNRGKAKVIEQEGVRYVAQDDVDRIVGETRQETRTRVEKELKEAAERAELEESGKFKELYEKSEAARIAAEKERDDAKLSALRVEIGEKFGLSATLSARLQGTTSAELTKDAKAIAEELGIDPTKVKEQRKPPATEGGNGSRTRKAGSGSREDSTQEGDRKIPTRRYGFESEGDVPRRWNG